LEILKYNEEHTKFRERLRRFFEKEGCKMIIETFDPSAVRVQPAIQSKTTEPEQARPVQATTESLNSGLDVNREKNAMEEKVDDRNRNSDGQPSTYDASGNQKESPSPPRPEGDSVDIFV